MLLNELIKRLNDLKLLYNNAVVDIKLEDKYYRIVSICGKSGERRPGEVPDPNLVTINIKEY